MSVVVSRPIIEDEENPVTLNTYDWAEDIVQCMKVGGLDVIDLGSDVAREDINEALSDKNVEMFVHYGHGYAKSLLGSNAEPILDNENIDLLKDKIVVNINCESADYLGYDIIEFGDAKSFIGFSDKVYIMFNNNGKTYTGFRESNNAWNKPMRTGKICTVEECFNEIGKTYDKWIDIYEMNGYPEITECLKHSRDCMMFMKNNDEEIYMPVQEPVELIYQPEVCPRNLNYFKV